MLLSLKNYLQADLNKNLASLQSHIEHVEERVDAVGRSLGEHADAYNSLSVEFHGHDNDIQLLKAKVADLEDRSRWNNLKFQGIPENGKTL